MLALLLAGPALGLFAWQADRVETTSIFASMISGLGNIPSPWLVLAFVAGVILARPGWGALGGTAVLCLAVAFYYTAITISGDRAGIPLRGAMTGWLAIALIAGPVFGTAGGAWRRGPALLRPFAVGLMTGALVGEAAYLGGDALRYNSWSWDDHRTLFVTAELGVALALPLLLLRLDWQRLQAYLTAGVMGAIALVTMLTLDQVMRDLFNA